jgi:hypothetical protein
MKKKRALAVFLSLVMLLSIILGGFTMKEAFFAATPPGSAERAL